MMRILKWDFPTGRLLCTTSLCKMANKGEETARQVVAVWVQVVRFLIKVIYLLKMLPSLIIWSEVVAAELLGLVKVEEGWVRMH